MNLAKLAEPFEASDIEWRVSRAGVGQRGIWCSVLAYITNRAVQKRLDDVCGKSAFAVGISIHIDGAWITKWDVSEPTNIEPAKGGFSGAMKRAGAQWGIGRYLYALDEVYADTEQTKQDGRQWNWAKLPKDKGSGEYWWKTPGLPAWALPKEVEHEVSEEHLKALKQAWRTKFAPEVKNPKDLREGFARFVASVCGEFPISDPTCWVMESLEKCQERINATTDANGPSSDVPFDK
jgi:hypothetical protein